LDLAVIADLYARTDVGATADNAILANLDAIAHLNQVPDGGAVTDLCSCINFRTRCNSRTHAASLREGARWLQQGANGSDKLPILGGAI